MDHKTFTSFLDTHQASIYRMIRCRVASDHDAEDILQEVLLKVYQHHDTFNQKSQIRTWLYSICKNATSDYFRNPWWKFSWIFESREQHENPSRQPEQQLIIKEKQQDVQKMVLSLAKQEQEVFRLRYFDHFSLQEIADCQGTSLSTVKTHLYRAVSKVRNAQQTRRGTR